jgi:hypothetical protein
LLHRREFAPFVAREDLLVGAICELGVGDRQRPAQVVVAADLVEPPVGLGVDARDEERGDRRRAPQVATLVAQAAQPAQVGLAHGAVALDREAQRHVDRDLARDRLLDRRQARLGGRDLHVEVRALDHGVQSRGLGDRGVGVVGQVRVDLQRHPAVTPSAVVPHRPQLVARGADVFAGERQERVLGADVLVGEHGQLGVVDVAVGDRALEDRRGRRDSGDAVAYQRGQFPVAHERPRQVVHPRAPAKVAQAVQACPDRRHVFDLQSSGISWGLPAIEARQTPRPRRSGSPSMRAVAQPTR